MRREWKTVEPDPRTDAQAEGTERLAEWVATLAAPEREIAFRAAHMSFAAAAPALRMDRFMPALRNLVSEIELHDAGNPQP